MRKLQFPCLGVLAAALLVGTMSAQTPSHPLTNGTSIEMPDLTITGSTISCEVSYDATRRVYRYAYTIHAPVTNLAAVRGATIDLSGKLARPQADASLAENVKRWTLLQATTTIPVGVTVPNRPQWDGSVNAAGRAYFTARESFAILPGGTKDGFVLESRLGPGVRTAELIPSKKAWWDVWENLPQTTEHVEFVRPLSERDFVITTTTIAPVESTDANLFSGGGQQPAEVNRFLAYAAPHESRNNVPANSSYTVIVYYGETINPSTFRATLDETDITGRFHPAPGGVDAVEISLATSTTKLHLSVDGTKASGGKATDSDTLTFLPR